MKYRIVAGFRSGELTPFAYKVGRSESGREPYEFYSGGGRWTERGDQFKTRVKALKVLRSILAIV